MNTLLQTEAVHRPFYFEDAPDDVAMTDFNVTSNAKQFSRAYRFSWLECCLLAAVLALFSQTNWPYLQAWLRRPLPGRQTEVEAQPYNYLIYLPPDFRHGEGRYWPLLLNLHGSGERGNDLQKLYHTGLPVAIAEGLTPPFIVISPQCPDDVSWDAFRLQELLADLEGHYPISCVAATGYSMGGFGCWSLAEAAPERLAAIAPICGGGNPANAEKLVHLPIWAFHGAKDEVVSAESSQRMVDAVNAAGGAARLTHYADKGHSIWDPLFRDQQLYHWLRQNCERWAGEKGSLP